MLLVKIEKYQQSPPSDVDITTAMKRCNGTVSSIVQDGAGTKIVYFTGDVNHTVFQNTLQFVAQGGQMSWLFFWGDSVTLQSSAQVGVAGSGYSITIRNNSQIDNSRAIVFQQDPETPSEVASLAWLSKMCHKNTQVTYNWTLNFNFVWGQNGNLKPGVSYQAGGSIPADLTANNQVTLDYVDGGFEFGPTSAGPSQGSLLIHESDNVPGAGNIDQGSVGIGMFGKGTFVRPTQPTGMSGGIQFGIHPEYWVAFGSYEEGEVVDTSVLYYPEQVMFSGNMFHADCAFDGRKWSISYS
ncbi:hypothetical protein [Streptomyces sp. URMC 125]|uniref:hypothetical protein n=1 Tax=Streptomyces sp. URMC 125 TaxID=3423419 RepID=UPI003F1C63C0